jgi:putative protease
VKKPEIMSPAGHWPQLRAAIEAGADAVYFGLKHFTARAKAGFELNEIPEVVRTLHARGVRGYLTFNTLVFEHELPEAARTIAALARAGVDALIVQDPGILELARRIAPSIELHASTQMSVTDAAGVQFARSLGVDRVTLARELTLAEIHAIHEETHCELEMFVHGALCVAYSGQCFSSEAWGGRSANRGQCAQACRLPYDMIVDGEHMPLDDARYLLSPGDLYTLREVEDIVATGVGALKIEGRYKDADYVALTTSSYRKAVDAAWASRPNTVTHDEEQRLEQVYSRGLGAHFIKGTNHQAVVEGRAPRHRGIRAGRVAGVEADHVVVECEVALKPGDGIVFDAAAWRSPEEPEEGGRIYEVRARRDGKTELAFGNGVVDHTRIRPGDLVWRTHDPALAAWVKPFLDPAAPVHRQPVSVKAQAREGQPLRTAWTLANGLYVEAGTVAKVEPARNRSLSLDILREQFGRLGNTPYELGDVTFESESETFVPVSQLNDVRREAVEKLQALQQAARPVEVRDPIACLEQLLRAAPEPTPDTAPQLHLLVRTPEQLEAATVQAPASITLDYLDLYGLRPSVERVKSAGIATRVASPRILKPGEARIVDFLVDLDCEILVRATGILHTLRDKRPRALTGDFSLNAANSLTARRYLSWGLKRLTPAHDLNAAQISDLARAVGGDALEAIAYQHLPVFHTEHCVFCRFLSTGTSYKDCGRPCEKHKVELRDREGRAHPVMADVGCRNTVFGAEAQEASAHLEAWIGAGIRHFRLEFAHESAAQVTHVAEAFAAALRGERTPAALQRELKSVAPEGITQGSLRVTKDYLTFPILQ